MSNRTLPDNLKRFYHVNTVDEMWYKILTEGNVKIRRHRPIYSLLPSNPRCANCHRPFAGVGGAFLRIVQKTQRSEKNPKFCSGCHSFTSSFPGGAEVELTMLFVDVRGSTKIAERMASNEFGRLMNRFYESAITVLVHADAFIDKLVGDEVVALFIPGYAGKDHATKAVEAGKALLRITGHGTHQGAWIPVGVGIHTGTAWVGSVVGAKGAGADFTALGDNVNITARLASLAGPGEVLMSEATCLAAKINTENLEKRTLELKGKSEPVTVYMLNSG